MRNPLDWLRQREARRRYMPRPENTGRAARTAQVAAVALVFIIIAVIVLESRAGAAETELVEHARQNAVDPLDMIEVAGRARRLLFLADISSAPAPKQFAARAIERLGLGPGLDLLVLNVPAAEQPWIDQYLATTPEDMGILLSRPRAIREDDGASRSFIDLYRAVWQVNQQLGAHRRIRIVAADHASWPPPRALSPQQAARIFGERDEHTLNAITDRALARNPGARVLFFVDGLHALESGGARIQSGGTSAVDVTWLAARLAERYPQDIFTILTDAVPNRAISPDVAAYRGTRLAEPLRRGGIAAGTALRASPALDAVARTPIRVISAAGLDFALLPRTAAFSDLADAYIYFGS
jgi:hypothetical protein